MTPRPGGISSKDSWFIGTVLAVAGAVLVLWLGAGLSAVISGNPAPGMDLHAVLGAVSRHRGDPSAAWGRPVGPDWLYWGCTLGVAFTVAVLVLLAFKALSRRGGSAGGDSVKLDAMASRREVARVAGKRGLLSRGPTLRPAVTKPAVTDLGHRLGRSRGVDCYTCVEDSLVLLGPPRSGKGLHVVINAILDAPGAVITTSTRPDNVTATLAARSRTGPVAVFDPQGLAPGLPSATRWSPIRGASRPMSPWSGPRR